MAARSSGVRILVGAPKWEEKAMRAIDAKKQIVLALNGPQAFAAWQALLRHRSRSVELATVREPTVVITAIIVAGVIAALGLGVLAAVLLYAISKNYKNIRAKFKSKGPSPWDDELSFDLSR